MTRTDNVLEIPDDYVARASYKNEIFQNGWAYLEVNTQAKYADSQQAYAAGYLEGYLSHDLIWMHWCNILQGFCKNRLDICQMVDDFVDANEEYMLTEALDNPEEPYWYQVQLLYNQLEGIAWGYRNATTDPIQLLTFRDIFWLNMVGDLDDLAFSMILRSNQTKRDIDPDPTARFDRCTGLVKLLPDFSNLYTSQTTWNSYNSMLRVQKMYVLNFHVFKCSKERIPGYKMSFSSYPGLALSLDDFYIISSGLVPAETTIGNGRRELFELIHPVGTILEFVRCMVANRLARDGREWVNIFSVRNSGTYNNQWYIVDYNKFKPAEFGWPGRVSAGLLWVVEQLPGNIEAADLTATLVETSFFASFNMAHFRRMFELGGGLERVRLYGDWFSPTAHPRARMLKKLQVNNLTEWPKQKNPVSDPTAGIHNMRDMFRVMRYNDYKHDPLARCPECKPPYSACNAVAARNDLNPANGTYPFVALGHRCHGAIDTKVTSARISPTYEFVAVSSPPYDETRGIPPFTWSKFDLGKNVSHIGHPDRWMFQPVRHRWEWG
ncbi:putative phospholipase B-like 2 [Leguminivora glycinivorella]|uniref:putative phospholipase B-like 2 n=1 Tax=Leguminivora glycinivorella TaxID=1035111 RepID=UPI00200DA640|nr:putative phospholipase B-like 2 [Leguminivora glycinivorella]